MVLLIGWDADGRMQRRRSILQLALDQLYEDDMAPACPARAIRLFARLHLAGCHPNR